MRKLEKIINSKSKGIFLIAEVSGNHQNSYQKLKKLLSSLMKAKADAIKFQVYKPDTITLNSKKKDFLVEKSSPWKKNKYLFDLYKKAYTPWEWISNSVKFLNKAKYPWLASVFDETSLKFMQNLNCKAYKIASPEITDINLIKQIALTKKPIILSTGVANLDDIKLAVRVIKKYHNKIVILKCTSEYPASYESLYLQDINLLKKKFNCAIGFSDHTLDSHAATIASYLGATVFEKHFKLNNDIKSIDQHFSMKVSEIKNYRDSIEIGKKIYTTQNFSSFYNISKKKKISNRSLYISKEIKKNQVLTNSHVRSVRPGYSLHPRFLTKIIGKRSKKKLGIGSRIKLKNFF
tara:strand:- start:65 stop:1111 length:1047 start_codon:yes stop_codon:yes gene_type:complete